MQDSPDDHKAQNANVPAAKGRDERLKAALKANMAKRKAQAKARADNDNDNDNDKEDE